jgi:alkyl hydroperoxide reductase subunit AhpF
MPGGGGIYNGQDENGTAEPGGEMAILTERDRAAVQTELAKLAGPVKLIVFSTQLGASEYCVETERLVREVAECSDQITVEILNLHIDRERAEAYEIDRVPAIVVEGARDYGIRFFGIPMGYEFTNLIDSMIVASSGTPSLGAETLERLAGLKERVHIQVFSTPT